MSNYAFFSDENRATKRETLVLSRNCQLPTTVSLSFYIARKENDSVVDFYACKGAENTEHAYLRETERFFNNWHQLLVAVNFC